MVDAGHDPSVDGRGGTPSDWRAARPARDAPAVADSGAAKLFAIVYDELRRIAAAHLRHERAGHTLQPTALVHEAYLRLAAADPGAWQGTAHFLAIASEAIRRILIDHARRRGARRRGGHRRRLTLSEATIASAASVPGRAIGRATSDDGAVDVLDLDAALERLRVLHPRHHEVARLRCFGGLTGAQIAAVLAVDRATVVRDWATARAWLAVELDLDLGADAGTDEGADTPTDGA